MDNGSVKFVSQFNDSVGRIKRQVTRFKVFQESGNGAREVKLSDDVVDKIVWTDHLANKKSIWYTLLELQGNLEFDPGNSYENQHLPKNNPGTTGEARKKLMIAPGPRSIDRPGDVVQFSRFNLPSNYQLCLLPTSWVRRDPDLFFW